MPKRSATGPVVSKQGPPKGYIKPAGSDGFERRESAGECYWDDPRWKKVATLRSKHQDAKANGIVDTIRSDWGVD